MTDYTFPEYKLPDDIQALAGTTKPATIRGVTFQFKPIMDAIDFGAFSTIASGEFTGNLFALVNDVIRHTLIESERERWDAFLAFEKDLPIEWQELVALADEIAGRAVGRPTVPPSPSGSTNGNSGTPSTGASASTVGPVLANSPSGPN